MKTLKRVSYVLFYSFISVLLLILIVAGFTQTRAFREALKDLITSRVSSSMNGTITMKQIGGNFVTGFTIDSIAVTRNGDTLVAVQKMGIRYEPISLFSEYPQIRDITLDHPRIYFKRPVGGSWNIGSLFTPSADTSTGGGGPVFDLHRLEIRQGEFKLTDSLSLAAADHTFLPEPSFEYHDFHLYDVNLVLSASLRNGKYVSHVSKLSCYSARPELGVTNFQADLSADSSRLTVANMVLQTQKSYVELDAEMRGVNIFRGIDLRELEHNQTSLRLRAGNVAFEELKQMLPPLSFLEGSASVECDASGEFGNLSVQRLNVNTLQSSLRFSGSVKNLHTPEKLYLNVLLHDSKLDPADPAKLMPSFSIPPFTHAGVADARIEFAGYPTNFSAKVDLSGAFGSLSCDASLNLHRTVPSYKARFTTKNVSIDNLFSVEGFHAVVSASGYLAGEGFTIETVRDSLSLTLDTTTIQRLKIGSGALNLHASARKFDVICNVEGRDMSATVNGKADFTNERIPSYRGEITLSSFDLSTLLNDDTYRSDLTLRTNVQGEGKKIDDLTGKIVLSLLPSMYQDRNIQPQELSLSLDQREAKHKHLSLESSFADAEMDGAFDLDLLVSVLAAQASNLISAVEEHATPVDSAAAKKPRQEFIVPPHTDIQRTFDLTYKITVNDLEPVAVLTGGAGYNARGTLQGTIKGNDRLLSLSAGGRIDELYIGTVAKGIFLTGTKLSFAARDLSPRKTLEQLALQCSLSVGSALVNNFRCNNFRLGLVYKNLVGLYSVEGLADSLYAIRSVGQASIQPHTYAIDMDTLLLGIRGYSWMNDQDVQMRVNYDGVRILHAEMRRNDERLSLVGIIEHSGTLSITGGLRGYRLEGLGTVLRNNELLKPGHGFYGTCDADLQLIGSTAKPVFRFTSTMRDVAYRQTVLGAVNASIEYGDSMATINITVKEHPEEFTPTLRIMGTLPIDLSFEETKERFPDAEQHLEIVSEGFDVSLLDPLLADFDNLSGKLKCNLSLLGTPRLPRYAGTISVADVRFTFGPNNIMYIVNGEFEPSENKLLIRTLTATNPPTEPRESDARFTGSLTIRNFQVESFNVTAYGKLLLMTDATKKAIKTFYGTLFTETNPDGINLRGTLDEPYLSGKLFVISADLVFPPTRSNSSINPNQALNYILVDDTVRQADSGSTFSSKFYKGYDVSSGARFTTVSRQYEQSFVDRLRYHLDVETRGTTAVRMIFTPSTNEELYAEIEGKVTAINNNGTATIYNEISVTSRSYYNFFKRFEATGKLNFVGPWDNPELHIEATYEGRAHIPGTADPTATESPSQTTETKTGKVIVELHITGTRYEPKLSLGMKVQDPKDPRGLLDWATLSKGGDVQSDAISFILTGKFREDLSSSERENLATNFGSAGVTGFTSNLLSGILTDFLRDEFPFIRNAEISYAGGNFGETANVGLSGEAWRGYFRINGRILNDLGNANVSYQTSVGDFINETSLRNLFIELERRVEGDYTEDRRLTNNARLFYRFSF